MLHSHIPDVSKKKNQIMTRHIPPSTVNECYVKTPVVSNVQSALVTFRLLPVECCFNSFPSSRFARH